MPPEGIYLTEFYWPLAKIRGVNPVMAYCQCCKETGWFYTAGTGVLNAYRHNPCGLKTAQGGADHDPASYAHFPDWSVGIGAHLDHLGLYAGAAGYPRAMTLDPRHFLSLLGTAKTVKSLGGKWGASADYGTAIVGMMVELESTPLS